MIVASGTASSCQTTKRMEVGALFWSANRVMATATTATAMYLRAMTHLVISSEVYAVPPGTRPPHSNTAPAPSGGGPGRRRRAAAQGLYLGNRTASPALRVPLAPVGRLRRGSPLQPGPDALEEAARPHELGRENGQADRNDDHCRPGQDDHRPTDQEHGGADHRDRDPPRALQHGVSEPPGRHFASRTNMSASVNRIDAPRQRSRFRARQLARVDSILSHVRRVPLVSAPSR